jgi:hypothetical protein
LNIAVSGHNIAKSHCRSTSTLYPYPAFCKVLQHKKENPGLFEQVSVDVERATRNLVSWARETGIDFLRRNTIRKSLVIVPDTGHASVRRHNSLWRRSLLGLVLRANNQSLCPVRRRQKELILSAVVALRSESVTKILFWVSMVLLYTTSQE